MRIGVLIPTRGVVMESARRPPVETCWTMARRADQAGYDAVWVGDSIVAKPRLDVLTTLAYLARITTRARLGTAVLLPALRHPVVLAQQLANIDMCVSNRHSGHRNAGSSDAMIKDRRSAGRFRAVLVIRPSAAMSSSRLSGRPLASVALKWVQTNSSGFRSGA